MKEMQELLENVLSKLIEINQRQGVIEAQQKLIMNRMVELPRSQYEPMAPPKLEKKVQSKIPVVGKIDRFSKEANKRIGVNMVEVTIFNANGEPIEVTKTNNAGQWRKHLPPGEYQAHYHKENFIEKNILFKVTGDEDQVTIPSE